MATEIRVQVRGAVVNFARDIGTVVAGADTIESFEDTDVILIVRSGTAYNATVTQLKAMLKTYFDTLYAATDHGHTTLATDLKFTTLGTGPVVKDQTTEEYRRLRVNDGIGGHDAE